jgi:phosphohistidine phosphatase
MRLYLVRHGEAEPAGERPLTAAGRQNVERVARAALRGQVRPKHIFHSGKLRAQQTAEILAQHLGQPDCRQVPGLNPNDDPDEANRLANSRSGDLMFVGHLPHLERFASLLLIEDDSPLVLFPPGGMACLERNPATRRWLLRWLITPETLE